MIYTSEITRVLQAKHWRRKGWGERRALQSTINEDLAQAKGCDAVGNGAGELLVTARLSSTC